MSARKDKLDRVSRNRANAAAGKPLEPQPGAQADLGDPKVQEKILFPDRYPLTISVDGEPVQAWVRTQFTYADLKDRHVLEDIEAYARLVRGEAASLGLDVTQPDVLAKQGYKFDAAMLRSHVRDAARDVLVSITTWDTPRTKVIDGREYTFAAPGRVELEMGVSGAQMAALGIWLITILNREIEKAKNAVATAPKSG